MRKDGITLEEGSRARDEFFNLGVELGGNRGDNEIIPKVISLISMMDGHTTQRLVGKVVGHFANGKSYFAVFLVLPDLVGSAHSLISIIGSILCHNL